jgi:hypothetical protein
MSLGRVTPGLGGIYSMASKQFCVPVTKLNLSTDRKSQILATTTTGSGISQSAQRLPTGWTVRSLTPGENKISLHTPVRIVPGAHLAPVHSETGLFPRGQEAGAWRSAPAPQPALRLRMSRTIPLLQRHAVVQFVEALRYNPKVGGFNSRLC